MFRFAVAALAIVGLVSLFAGGASAAATGVGFLVLAPLFFLFKLMFFFMLLGFIAKGFKGGRGRGWHQHRAEGRGWSGGHWDWSSRRPTEDAPSTEDRFDEWHRMAHAKEEVDSWAPEEEV